MHRFLAILFIILGVLVFQLAPLKYDYSYSVLCGIIYAVTVVIYYLVKRKKNYFDFDSLFLFTFFFVMLYYPIFMFENDATRFFMFIFGFDENLLPKGSALAVLGLTGYLAGGLVVKESTIPEIIIDSRTLGFRKKINTKPLYIITIVFFLLFIVTGGYNKMADQYETGQFDGGGGISGYFYVLFPPFMFAGIILDYYNLLGNKLAGYKEILRSFSFLSISVPIFICLLMIFTGSRTLPLEIVVVFGGLYATLVKNISFPKFCLFLIAGIFIMFIVVVGRGYEQEGKFTFIDLLMDLVINNRSSYVALEIVNSEGINYGKSMLSPISSPVPMLQNILIQSGLRESDLSSSQLITAYTFGDFEGFGLGTNVVADIYLAFGGLGVILLMFLLGWGVNYSRSLSTRNVYFLMLYGIFISYAVFLVRAEYFVFLRNAIWCSVIVFFTVTKFNFNHSFRT